MNAMIPQLYGPSHRAARLALSDFLVRASLVDGADPIAFRAVLAAWQRTAALIETQNDCEDIHIHPMIHVAAPDLALRLDRQHEAIGRGLRSVGAVLQAVDGLDEASARRIAAGEAYLAFSALMSEIFLHLVEEETQAMSLLAARFAPPALFAAERTLRGSLPQTCRSYDMPVIARAIPPQDITRALCASRDAAMPAFFAEAHRTGDTATDRAGFDRAAARRAAA